MDIVERLRGIYRAPITDGLEAAGGDEPDNPHEFARKFETPPIQHEAADEIERLREALREIYEVYAGSEGIPQPMTAAEGYLLSLLMEAVEIASKALKEKE